MTNGLDVFYFTDVLAEAVQKINSMVIEAGPYSFDGLALSNPKKKYHFIKDIKNGLKVPVILLVYSPGK